MAGSMVYRLRVSDPSDEHMRIFRDAMSEIQQLMDPRGFNHIAGFHGAPGEYCWHHQFRRGSSIRASLFLPWHRAYLWWLEQALQDRNENVALPWWDWTSQRGIPDAYDESILDAQPNPLHSFHARVPGIPSPIDKVTTRSPAIGVPLPSGTEIVALLDDSDWQSFSDRLQDYHDFVHGWVGGDMSITTTAAFDPIFYAHHCMVDLIWYLWQIRHGVNNIPGGLLSMTLDPFGKSVEDVLDVQSLGYEYALTAADVPVEDD